MPRASAAQPHVHLLEPHATNPGDDAKYSVMLMIPKSDGHTPAAPSGGREGAAAEAASSRSWGKIREPGVHHLGR